MHTSVAVDRAAVVVHSEGAVISATLEVLVVTVVEASVDAKSNTT
jgi:hypothetical protein